MKRPFPDARRSKAQPPVSDNSSSAEDDLPLTEKLNAAQQHARSLIEASLDPLVTISPDGKVTDVNEATMTVTGASRQQLIGSDFSDYFTEPEKARERAEGEG